MSKKVIHRRKWKLKNILLILLVLLLVTFCGYFLWKAPIKNILIKNTTYIKDDDILEIAGIKNYPSFLFLSSKKVEKKLEKLDTIQKARVYKKYPFTVEIVIEENTPLFWSNQKKGYVLANGFVLKEEQNNFYVPRLTNEVPTNQYERFLKEMGKVKPEVLSKISDITYEPNEYDKDRFLLYMDDGNMVYLTLTKFKMINHYNEVLKQLENHKGILYLDNGNHFQIKE